MDIVVVKQCGNRNGVNQKRLNIICSVKSVCVEFEFVFVVVVMKPGVLRLSYTMS